MSESPAPLARCPDPSDRGPLLIMTLGVREAPLRTLAPDFEDPTPWLLLSLREDPDPEEVVARHREVRGGDDCNVGEGRGGRRGMSVAAVES